MKKRKLELYITGKLMFALMVGRPAIFSTGGEMYHTAPVVKIHETETQEIHFETSCRWHFVRFLQRHSCCQLPNVVWRFPSAIKHTQRLSLVKKAESCY